MDYIVVYGIYKQNHLNVLYKRYDKNNIESRGKMKRKIKRKLLYLAMSLVIIISLSFSACNSNNTQDNLNNQKVNLQVVVELRR